MRQTVTIPPAEIDRQLALCDQIHTLLEDRPGQKLAFVDTYGCQQNEADSERLRGYLARMGYAFSDTEEGADLVLLNTCAVREHAEQRVFGNVGALSHTKRRHPGQIICVCGCMARQEHVVERLKKSFPYVDLVFGPQLLWQFPELLMKKMTEGKRVFAAGDEIGTVAEGIPTVRQNRLKGWVSIMYGCNNFCTYCIVPYVRGRERSRQPQEILDEVRSLVDAGYKDITLLGQNVNSYGKDLDLGVDFAWLLEQVNAIPGEFLIRFMTSHPKDAGPRLFDAMAAQLGPDETAIRIVPGLDPDGLHRLAARLSESTTGLCAALTPNEKGTGYCIARSGGDVRPLTKALNAALNGRGGGKPGICQGSCTATPEQVEEFLRKAL